MKVKQKIDPKKELKEEPIPSTPIRVYQNTNLGPWTISKISLPVVLSTCEKIIIRYWSYYIDKVKNQAHKHEFQKLKNKSEVAEINNKRAEIFKNFKFDKNGVSKGLLKTAVIHVSNYYYDKGEQKIEICQAPCCDLLYVSSTNCVDIFGYRGVCADVANNSLLISQSLYGDELCVIDSVSVVFRS